MSILPSCRAAMLLQFYLRRKVSQVETVGHRDSGIRKEKIPKQRSQVVRRSLVTLSQRPDDASAAGRADGPTRPGGQRCGALIDVLSTDCSSERPLLAFPSSEGSAHRGTEFRSKVACTWLRRPTAAA